VPSGASLSVRSAALPVGWRTWRRARAGCPVRSLRSAASVSSGAPSPHAGPERGIRLAGAIIPSLPSTAFRRPRIVAPEFAGSDSPVEACLSKRPFAHRQRAYPLRHSHGRVTAPGLFLRGNVPSPPKPLTLNSLPHRPCWRRGRSSLRIRAPVLPERSRLLTTLSLPFRVFQPVRLVALGVARLREAYLSAWPDDPLLPDSGWTIHLA
jgi:hypothetical protein